MGKACAVSLMYQRHGFQQCASQKVILEELHEVFQSLGEAMSSRNGINEKDDFGRPNFHPLSFVLGVSVLVPLARTRGTKLTDVLSWGSIWLSGPAAMMHNMSNVISSASVFKWCRSLRMMKASLLPPQDVNCCTHTLAEQDLARGPQCCIRKGHS